MFSHVCVPVCVSLCVSRVSTDAESGKLFVGLAEEADDSEPEEVARQRDREGQRGRELS